MAAFCFRSVSLVPDHENACCCFDDVIGDGFELVDFEDAGDLREKTFEDPEVEEFFSAGGARYRWEKRACSASAGPSRSLGQYRLRWIGPGRRFLSADSLCPARRLGNGPTGRPATQRRCRPPRRTQGSSSFRAVRSPSYFPRSHRRKRRASARRRRPVHRCGETCFRDIGEPGFLSWPLTPSQVRNSVLKCFPSSGPNGSTQVGGRRAVGAARRPSPATGARKGAPLLLKRCRCRR